LVEEAGFEPA